jgi:predicted transcriptional regulator
MNAVPDFSELKREAMQMLAAVEDAEILARVREILNESQELSGAEWWNSLPLEHQARITNGIADIDAGRVIPHSEVLKRMEQWRKR